VRRRGIPSSTEHGVVRRRGIPQLNPRRCVVRRRSQAQGLVGRCRHGGGWGCVAAAPHPALVVGGWGELAPRNGGAGERRDGPG
jgi:hypothetical protein